MNIFCATQVGKVRLLAIYCATCMCKLWWLSLISVSFQTAISMATVLANEQSLMKAPKKRGYLQPTSASIAHMRRASVSNFSLCCTLYYHSSYT